MQNLLILIGILFGLVCIVVYCLFKFIQTLPEIINSLNEYKKIQRELINFINKNKKRKEKSPHTLESLNHFINNTK